MCDNDSMYWDEEDQQWYSYPEDKDCLFIFDWDNTLLPNKVLNNLDILRCTIPDDLKADMEDLSNRLIRVLSRAVEIGEALVITNGSRGWVRRSAIRCFPDVLTFIDENDIDIISGRDRYREQYPRNQQVWKDRTFYEEVEEYVVDCTPTAELFSLVSIGDSNVERLAALALTTLMPRECIKAVQLEVHDDLENFKEQVDKVLNILQYTKDSNDHLDIDI